VDTNVIGLIASFVVIVILTMRGFSVVVVAPLAVAIVSLLSRTGVLDALMGPYMTGGANYIARFYLVFLFGSVFGSYMDNSGAARAIAMSVMKLTGKSSKLIVLLIISGLTVALTYGGVSLFVVIFAVMPVARPIFKEMNIPWHFFVACLIWGTGTVSLGMGPGSPSILNIMPMKYLGTPATAAPLLGTIASVFVTVYYIWYLKWQLKKCADRNEVFIEPAWAQKSADEPDRVLPPFIISVIPPVAIVVALDALKLDIVWSLIIGCVLAAGCFWRHIESHQRTLNTGAANSVIPALNTAAGVGFGTAAAAMAGFKVVSNFLVSIPGNPLISMVLATFVLCGITGSSTGGAGIMLETLMPRYVALGINHEVLHRVLTIAAGTFDCMPHCGTVITTLTIAGLTHKQAYHHVFYTKMLATFLATCIILPCAILFY
jgi:H+/gluconate symporter-like permease